MAHRTFNAPPHPMLKCAPFSERWHEANANANAQAILGGYKPVAAVQPTQPAARSATPPSKPQASRYRGYAKLHGQHHSR